MTNHLAKSQKASELTEPDWIKALLLGESKTGKTEGATTLPLINAKPILVLALTPRTRPTVVGKSHVELLEIFEDETIKKTKGQGQVYYDVKPKAWEMLWDTVIELWEIHRNPKQDFPYSGVILDDLSAANRFSMNHVLNLRTKDGKETAKNLGGAAAEHHYVPQMHMMTQLIYSFLLTLPCHIVVCGHMDLYENEETKVWRYLPRVYGKIRTEMSSWFNEVYECYRKNVRGEGIKYFWNMQGEGQKDILGSALNTEGRLVADHQFVLIKGTQPYGFAKLWEMRDALLAGKEVTGNAQTS